MSRALLIIPCFQERERLPRFLPGLLEILRDQDVVVRVVDDGSSPDQQNWLRAYVAELQGSFPGLATPQINPVNEGKGGAIYSGWDQPGEAALLAFADADGAVPPAEVARLLRVAMSAPERAVFAVRTGECGTRVSRALHRRIAGWVFRRLVRRFFRFPLPDTQCGCKVVPASAYAAFREHLQERRFTFDVELTWHLLRRGVEITPIPVDWSERPGSHLRAASVVAMFRSLRGLRRRLGDWRTPGH
jgi:dolichyl-phosphate beta-glucosyltransferase